MMPDFMGESTHLLQASDFPNIQEMTDLSVYRVAELIIAKDGPDITGRILSTPRARVDLGICISSYRYSLWTNI